MLKKSSLLSLLRRLFQVSAASQHLNSSKTHSELTISSKHIKISIKKINKFPFIFYSSNSTLIDLLIKFLICTKQKDKEFFTKETNINNQDISPERIIRKSVANNFDNAWDRKFNQIKMPIFGCLKLKAGVSRADEVQEFIRILADERLQVIASDVVLEFHQNNYKFFNDPLNLPILIRRYKSCSRLTSMIHRCPELRRNKKSSKSFQRKNLKCQQTCAASRLSGWAWL